MAFTPRRLMQGASGASIAQYQIARSLRFNAADSAYLTRNFTGSGNQQKWTWSAWIKRSDLTETFLFGRSSGTNDGGYLNIQLAGSAYSQINFSNYSGSINVTTTQVLRDVSAWYHIVFALDTTQATAADRIKIYVNGVQVTAFSSATYPSLNDSLILNGQDEHVIGDRRVSVSYAFNGYMTEVNFVNAQQLTPSSFGETNAQTGVWQPKAYSGSYGTNGFYLNFSDNSNTTAATLGKDYSGNGNNWTPNNFSVTAGAGNDSVVDSPTSYGTDTGVGGEVRGNYATLNRLHGVATSGSFYLTNGSLDLNVLDNSGYRNFAATISPEGFKGYCEVRMATDPNFQIGFAFESILPSNTQYQTNPPNAFYMSGDGNFRSGQTVVRSAYTPSFASGDILQIAFDFTGGARNIWFGRNGTWGTSAAGVGVPATGTNPIFTVSDLSQACRLYFGINTGAGTVTINTNFGQRPFAYTAPSGFKALCTQNLPTPTIGATTATTADKYFGINLWTGNGTSQTLTNSGGFQPDWVWLKSRSSGTNFHNLYDVLRGATKYLFSNTTAAEGTNAQALTAFTSTGFSVGNDNDVNQSSGTYVGWQWKAGGTGVNNTSGSITSSVSASPTSGFSVVTYSGNSTNGATIGHGLGVAPVFVIVKSRNDTFDWIVWSRSFATNSTTAFLNTTDAAGAYSVWNSTLPSSTVITLPSSSYVNGTSKTYVAYCFAPVAGYSAFGSYTGNGSADGPFVFTGMRPAFLMVKNSSNPYTDWYIMDATRNTYNAAGLVLRPNTSTAEQDYTPNVDFLSNGFKIRDGGAPWNGSAETIIYMAFAQTPFKYAIGR
jgi:hypothetical protein